MSLPTSPSASPSPRVQPLPLRPALRHANSSSSPSATPASSPPSGSTVSFPAAGLPEASHTKEGSGGASSRSGGTGSLPPRARTYSGERVRYRRRVGFDALESEDISGTAMSNFTLQATTRAYRRSKNTRTFLVGASSDANGEGALDWLMDQLLEDGDEVLAMRVFEEDSGKTHEDAREEAQELMDLIISKNDEYEDREISIVVEFVAGRITSAIRSLIAMYRPDSLIVGTRGKSGTWNSLGAALSFGIGGGGGSYGGMGSVSRWCLSHSPIPVIVVRPDKKVQKSLKKRKNDPKRRSYQSLVTPNSLARARSHA